MARKAVRSKAPRAASAASWRPAPGEAGIRVRMYRVGFGDFFVVTLLDANAQPLHILVDCGVFKGTSQSGDLHSIEAAVGDMAALTGGRLELVVVTHRHADHIAGFARCAAVFKKMTVGAVWMPIWESEYEPVAVKFQAELVRTAFALQRHFFALGAAASPEQRSALQFMENATGAAGAAAAGSNDAALALLKRGFAGVTPKYYKANDKPEVPAALVEAGLAAKVLGPPPLDDLQLMKLMDLQKGVGQYLAEEAGDEAGAGRPFAGEWEIAPAEALASPGAYAPESFREWTAPRKSWGDVTLAEARAGRVRMEKALQASQPIAALMAAKQLNSFLNNQSLVLLFTFKGRNLLFVGDAQAGNWEHWLFETDTPDKKGSATVAAAAQKLLASLDFYKVGHHGSGNATPKAAADLMTGEGHKFAAMCSTEAHVYGTEDPEDPSKGTEVPRGPLLDKLASRAALVRSDQIPIKVAGKTTPARVKAALPGPIPGSRFEKGDFWIDCFL